jgi:adenosylmethionine-8-amino-7-oxononanoate aminotransferase
MASQRTKELVAYDREHILHAQIPLGENLGVIYDRAEGVRLWDTEGKMYLDASSQMVSCNLGHGRREIIEAAQRQLDKLQHVGQYYGHSSTPMVECAMKLAEVTPGDLDRFWFTSGGGEATDAAVRLSRRYWTAMGQPTKQKVISLYMSYHGTGSGPMNMTGIPAMQAGYGPQVPGYLHIPAYYCYRCPFGLAYPSCDMRCARHLETIIEAEGPENIAAFIAEPELGASGFLVPPDEYWPLIREICTKHDVTLIADEVMCGFCRTGTMFCIDHWDVVPDVIAMSKGITSGYLPFGAVAFNDKIWDGLKGTPLMHQYTFSGAPAPCAAAIAAIDVYVNDHVAENATRVGQHIVDRIEAELLPMPCVGTHSGLGLMLAIEIVADKETKAMFDPPLAPIMPLLDEARRRGLHLRQMGSNRIVIAPPCTTTTEEADEIFDILKPLVAAIERPDRVAD